MIERKEYLSELLKWKDDNVIKIITGIRRCGKSTLLKLFKNHLIEIGVSEENIIDINFEDLKNEELTDYKALYEYICSRLKKGKMTYILLDEIQNVKEFQKAIDSLYIQENTDIYLTGSNAYMLSGEIATLLSGRYVEISMLPFSFKEYCLLNATTGDKETVFREYMGYGGFPYVSEIVRDREKAYQYLDGIFNTIIVKDVEERKNREYGKNRASDVSVLRAVTKYLADVVGSLISIKGISDYLTSNNRKISVHTVNDYVNALTEAFVFYPAERFDLQGKEILKTNKKYYIVDMGLKNILTTKRNTDLGYSLENVVYLELLRRGYKVYVGKYGTKEVDFIAKKNDSIHYYQVSAALTDEKTFDREITPLKEIKDNYPKTILTLDKFTQGNYDGIIVENIIEWLLD